MSRRGWTQIAVSLDDAIMMESRLTGVPVIDIARKKHDASDSPEIRNALDQIVSHHRKQGRL